MNHRNISPLAAAGMLLGIGLGGLFDGILLHQVFQTHSMMSAMIPRDSVANMELNLFWDGLMHALCWLVTLAGVVTLFSVGRRSDVPWTGTTLVGGLLLGWGLFNILEAVINHHILGTHHVVERLGLSEWDFAFLVFGIMLFFIGAGIIQGERRTYEYPSAARMDP